MLHKLSCFIDIINYKHAYLEIIDRYCFDNGYIVR